MDNLLFEVNATSDQKTLSVGYRVTNRSNRDVYLLNRLYRSTPSWQFGSDIAFVEFDRMSGAVKVSKRIPVTPPNTTITMPYSPFVTPVRAQKSFSEVIHLPLPLAEFKQAGNVSPVEGATPELVHFNKVTLQVQYYWRPDGTTEETTDVHGSEVLIPKTPPGSQLTFGFLESKELPVHIVAAVYNRTENP